jgi:hypothetical protein
MKLQLRSGRSISLTSLIQYRTYAGLLAGRPYRERNDGMIQQTLRRAMEEHPGLRAPFLVNPRRDPLEGRELSVSTVYERLPSITCIGVFDSDELNKPGSEPYSSLTVVWFQDGFACPIDKEVQAAIQNIEWDNCAADWMP